MPHFPIISVVLPCLNEEATLADCITRLRTALEASGLSGVGEIIVADNGSTDRSVRTAEPMGVRVLNVEERGYGWALSAGIQAAASPHVVFVDADGTYPLELVSELYRQTLESGAVLGLASRLSGQIEEGAMPWLHRWIGTPLDSRLGQADGAGAAVTALCQFTQADNYAPATVGQLKNVAKVFYDRLGQIGYNWQTGTFGFPSTPYPWTGTINAENQAPCNLGQLKNLFTFEISPAFLVIDGDGDGLPAWWETLYGFDPLVWSDANIDSDLDGLNDGAEYVSSTNPHVTDTDGDEASDEEERASGTDAKKNTSTPLAFCYIVHGVNWSMNYLPPDPPNGAESPFPEWFDGLSGYYPRQGDHQGTIFASCYPGRDRLGVFYREGGSGGPKYSEIPIFSSQIPLIPAKDLESAIIHGLTLIEPVELHSKAEFRSDGEGSVYTEAMGLWIRGSRRTLETSYLLQVTKTHLGPSPTVEVSYETIVIPPNVNSSEAKPFMAELSHASARRSYIESTHLRLDLLPVEVRAFQDVYGPHGSPPMYLLKPDDGQPFGDLLSVWPGEKMTFYIGEPIAGMLRQNLLPAEMIKWRADGIFPLSNTEDFEVQWSTPGLKHVNLQVGSATFKLYVNVPDTGAIDFKSDPSQDGPLIAAIGFAEYTAIALAGLEIQQRVINRYGQTGGTGGTKQDAIRHSSWNAFGAWHVGVGKAKMITFSTANEYHGRYFAAGFASNTTMDLHNNDHGATTGGLFMGIPTATAEGWIDTMEQEYDLGKLRIWTPPNANVNNHSHVLKKSDGKRIFAP